MHIIENVSIANELTSQNQISYQMFLLEDPHWGSVCKSPLGVAHAHVFKSSD